MTIEEALEKARHLDGSEPLYEMISVLVDIVENAYPYLLTHVGINEMKKFEDLLDNFIEIMEIHSAV